MLNMVVDNDAQIAPLNNVLVVFKFYYAVDVTAWI